jgi:hypothetical protein
MDNKYSYQNEGGFMGIVLLTFKEVYDLLTQPLKNNFGSRGGSGGSGR